MQSGNRYNFNEERTRKVGYAYYLFSLTFFISIIATLTLQSDLSYISLFFGFIGLIIVLISRKTLELNFKDDLLRGIGVYIFFEIVVSAAAIIYILSAASSLVAMYPNGVYPSGAFSNMVITGVYIEATLYLPFYISFYFMNKVFYKDGKESRLIVLLLLSFILYIVSFAGEIPIITSKLSTVYNLTTAESAIDLIKAHPLNIFTIPSVLGSLILLLIFYYSGRAIVINPSPYTDSGRYW